MGLRSFVVRAVTLGLVPLALAEIVTFSPDGQNETYFSITASSPSGPIFFQIQAPDTLQWVGLGQGTGMAGANIFVLYSSSESNVTVSPRSGKGHSMPEPDPEAQITLLEGAGIENGTMRARVRCDSCMKFEDDLSTSSWIWAYKEGDPLNSPNVSERIRIHDNFGETEIDLAHAVSKSDNPFIGYDPSSNAKGLKRSGGGSAMVIAHGFLMAFAFVLLFPAFAILVPLPIPISVAKVHAPLQAFTLAVAIAGMGLGLHLWVRGGVSHVDVHHILGIIVMAFLILFQPAMGWLQHMHFRKRGTKSSFAYAHRWLGRILIILGIINGGLGFRLAGIGSPSTPRSAMIAYSVIAGVMGLAYISAHLVMELQGRKEQGPSAQQEVKTPSGSENAAIEPKA
ncbi:cytochrome and DOMON domain-containing protein [Aspergillus affinis]|uniref:cytochrome and DOMON domain-containing protein n=1 Tax=Aspergillus affinis TaxID=1070780 RepID=UPI0022FE9113|nr:uncharacterized protein KD926_009098 [Aspergillus affinis]KAI9039755.1 hypothetical protein KD926_009098 [Aspergillus affinis]